MLANSLSLLLPEVYRLRGDENYVPWRKKIINVALSNDLIKHIYERGKLPEEVDEFGDNVDTKKLKA
jgi:hypothetical protein